MFISYDPHYNDSLLMYYGFLEEGGNPRDTYQLEVLLDAPGQTPIQVRAGCSRSMVVDGTFRSGRGAVGPGSWMAQAHNMGVLLQAFWEARLRPE